MSRRLVTDFFTSTPEDAAAFERDRARAEHLDNRPTKAECEADAAADRADERRAK